MNDTLNIFILAAGLGERLRPITDYIAKPLVPLLGKPALQYVLDNALSLPFHKIGINLHYKKESVEEWVSHSSLKERIILFPERSILGTGGALRNAGEFLKEGTFLVHNSDILSDINLRSLIDYHRSTDNLVTLAVHDCQQFNTLLLDSQGHLTDIESSPGSRRKRAFTGIAVYEPDFLKFLPPDRSSVVDAWLKALNNGHRVGTFDVSGCYWRDIGTPSSYAAAVFYALRTEGETVYIHPAVKECGNVNLQGHVVIEGGAGFQKTVSLRNCIVLPGSMEGIIHELPLLENCIIGPDFKIDVNESEILFFEKEGRQLIGTGGSDRKYFRVWKKSKSVVLMQCRTEDSDFDRHILYTQFFTKQGVPVPQLVHVASEKKQVLFEDAGDISLYSYLKCARRNVEIERVYKKVLDSLIQIHTKASENVRDCPVLQERIFDYEHFRWETDYFFEKYVKGIKHISIKNTEALEKEFHELAVKADSFPKKIIHRDFQSQNIMLLNGQEIRIIDYQGARIGPPAYDVASLLWDPYYRLQDRMRNRLLKYYIKNLKDQSIRKFDEITFKESLISCKLQRHMQALGAYAFLSSVKGKKYFFKYVPEGVRLLKEDISLSKNEYPELYTLIAGLQ